MNLLKNVIPTCILCNTILEPKYAVSRNILQRYIFISFLQNIFHVKWNSRTGKCVFTMNIFKQRRDLLYVCPDACPLILCIDYLSDIDKLSPYSMWESARIGDGSDNPLFSPGKIPSVLICESSEPSPNYFSFLQNIFHIKWNVLFP